MSMTGENTITVVVLNPIHDNDVNSPDERVAPIENAHIEAPVNSYHLSLIIVIALIVGLGLLSNPSTHKLGLLICVIGAAFGALLAFRHRGQMNSEQEPQLNYENHSVVENPLHKEKSSSRAYNLDSLESQGEKVEAVRVECQLIWKLFISIVPYIGIITGVGLLLYGTLVNNSIVYHVPLVGFVLISASVLIIIGYRCLSCNDFDNDTLAAWQAMLFYMFMLGVSLFELGKSSAECNHACIAAGALGIVLMVLTFLALAWIKCMIDPDSAIEVCLRVMCLPCYLIR